MSVIRDRCEQNGDFQHGSSGSSSVVGDGTNYKRSPSRRSRMLSSKLSHEITVNSSSPDDSGALDESYRSLRSRRGVHGESMSQSLHGALNQTSGSGVKTTKTTLTREVDHLSQSLHRTASPYDYAKATNLSSLPTAPFKTQSMRLYSPKGLSRNNAVLRISDDSSIATMETGSLLRPLPLPSTVPHFEQLCSACEALDYPHEYADIVGSQFLGFESASPITHVDGHVPTMDELVEFLALVFIQMVDFAHLITIFLDDFQWLDAFSWRIFRVICSRAGKTLLICASRSHDKQALRRIMNATTPDSRLQSQMIEISLGPLDFVDIRDLMSDFMVQKRSAISDEICSDIFQRTGGLPVYVVQLLENIKRMRTLELVDGQLQWNAEGLKQKVSSTTLTEMNHALCSNLHHSHVCRKMWAQVPQEL